MTAEKPTISDAAAQWVVKIHLGTLSEADQRELDAWIAADVRHEGALARARAAWVDLDRLAALGAGRVSSEPDVSVRVHGYGARWLSLAACLVAALLLGGVWFAERMSTHTYVSGVGELRKVPLVDGSTMVLNTATTARVSFDEGRRSVRLIAGEALFEVAKDASRPFVVTTGNVTVTAVGTAFVVRADQPSSVGVTVTEGVVEILDTSVSPAPLRVAANEHAVVGGREPPTLEHSLPRVSQRRLAWRNGMIELDGEPLSVAVEEFNRYSRRRIVIDDPALAARPITGVFRTTSIDEFAHVAAAVLGAVVSSEGETIRIRAR